MIPRRPNQVRPPILRGRLGLFYFFLSSLSFALPSAIVCHCMLDGSSLPPLARGTMWSITYPGQAPELFPFAGHGCDLLNVSVAASLRTMRPRASRGQSGHAILLFKVLAGALAVVFELFAVGALTDGLGVFAVGVFSKGRIVRILETNAMDELAAISLDKRAA